MRHLERAAHEAMARCFNDYRRTAGQWLWKAPEYLLTTYLYQGLAGQNLAECIRPEHNISDFLNKAGIRGRGRAQKAWRHKGRADLTFWDQQDQPTGLIEVKCPVSAYCAIASDHARVESIYRRYADDSPLRFCGLAFYTDQKDGSRKLSHNRVIDSLTSIRSKFECDHHAKASFFPIDGQKYRIQRYENASQTVTFSYVLTDVPEEESTWATALILWHR